MAFTDYDKCSLLLPMDGANNGTTFEDWSPNPKTVTANGNAKTVTTQSKYYGSSGYFDGAGDNLQIPANDAFSFGSDDFTIAAWMRLNVSKTTTGNYSGIVSRDATTLNRGWLLTQQGDSGGKIIFAFRDGTTAYTVSSSTIPVVDVWYHIAAIRYNDTLTLYIAGTGESSLDVTGASVNDNPTYDTFVGTICSSLNSPAANFDLNGYLQDLIIINGSALWTSDFTPPPRLIGEISGTVKDKDDNVASRIITACPRSNPTRAFSTVSSAGDGSYTLIAPATEVSRIALADETVLYNDIVDRIIPE